MSEIKYAERKDVVHAVGEISLNFAQLEDTILSMIGWVSILLPQYSELYEIGQTTGFKRKTDALKKYAVWYFEQVKGAPNALLLDQRGDELVKFLGRCDDLAQERNKYVHALLHHYDPQTILAPLDVHRPKPIPTLEFKAQKGANGKSVLQPVTMEVLNDMGKLSARISDAYFDAVSIHLRAIVDGWDHLRKQRIPTSKTFGFGNP